MFRRKNRVRRAPEYNSILYPQKPPMSPAPARPPENEPRDTAIILLLVLFTMGGLAIFAFLKGVL